MLTGTPFLLGSRPILLEGRVLSTATRLVVQDVEVGLVVSGLETTTDAGGIFSFGTVDIPVTDTLLVTHPDFHPLRLPLGTPDDGHWDLRILLVPTSESSQPTQSLR